MSPGSNVTSKNGSPKSEIDTSSPDLFPDMPMPYRKQKLIIHHNCQRFLPFNCTINEPWKSVWAFNDRSTFSGVMYILIFTGRVLDLESFKANRAACLS